LESLAGKKIVCPICDISMKFKSVSMPEDMSMSFHESFSRQSTVKSVTESGDVEMVCPLCNANFSFKYHHKYLMVEYSEADKSVMVRNIYSGTVKQQEERDQKYFEEKYL